MLVLCLNSRSPYVCFADSQIECIWNTFPGAGKYYQTVPRCLSRTASPKRAGCGRIGSGSRHSQQSLLRTARLQAAGSVLLNCAGTQNYVFNKIDCGKYAPDKCGTLCFPHQVRTDCLYGFINFESKYSVFAILIYWGENGWKQQKKYSLVRLL